jgi:hypothetical protein
VYELTGEPDFPKDGINFIPLLVTQHPGISSGLVVKNEVQFCFIGDLK